MGAHKGYNTTCEEREVVSSSDWDKFGDGADLCRLLRRIIWVLLAILPTLTLGWVVESSLRSSEEPTLRSVPATMMHGGHSAEGQEAMYTRIMARRGSAYL